MTFVHMKTVLKFFQTLKTFWGPPEKPVLVTISGAPRKCFGLVNPFLLHLYLKKEIAVYMTKTFLYEENLCSYLSKCKLCENSSVIIKFEMALRCASLSGALRNADFTCSSASMFSEKGCLAKPFHRQP